MRPHSLYPGFPSLTDVNQEGELLPTSDFTVDQMVSALEYGIFPSSDLVALGGDLTIERLLIAYRQGIYPFFTDDSPFILWWSPDPRTVLFPERFKTSRSLQKSVKNRGYRVTIDQDFEAVIRSCATVERAYYKSDAEPEKYVSTITWITREMIEAYCELHRLGFAHSVETWHGTMLVGGLYGVAIGQIFFGESLFYKKRDASKVALHFLVEQLRQWGYSLIDCQDPTTLLLSLGAVEIRRDEFLKKLKEAVVERQPAKAWR